MSTQNGKKPKTFKSMLAGLTCEKHKIGHLTQQARADLAHEETLAEVDVNAITSFIVNRNANDRLAGIYLIDSICQNVGGKYVPLFEEHIFPLIETTYRYGSSQTRKTLCKILNIWKSRKIFPIDILRNIYKAISNQQNSSSQPIQSSLAQPYYYAQPQPQQQPQQYYPYYQHTPRTQAQYKPWQAMCSKYGISVLQYESVTEDLIASISAFFDSPYTYHNGIVVETPQLKNANWNCPQPIMSEFNKCVSEFREYHVDITRKLYFICSELKHQGCNTWAWHNKLSKISPMTTTHATANTANANANATATANANGKGEKKGVCEFYNSYDGCRSGANCPYSHVTTFESEVRTHLLLRVSHRYQYKDIKFIDDCSDLKITTFYTYFGSRDELKKKHARSISLLYSKKLKVCPNCSLRITTDAFSKHMKWHFHRRNSILIKKRQTGFKSQQYGQYRDWYKPQQAWLNNESDVNYVNNALLSAEINPFEEIESSNQKNKETTMVEETVQREKERERERERDHHLYLESQVILSGISQIVICEICQEQFSKSNKEYNAQKDDWILKNACYSDGSNDNKSLKIVHRKCFELKKKQSIAADKELLKPKLYNKHNTLSKIEDQLNTAKTTLAIAKPKKRKINTVEQKEEKKRKLNESSNDYDDIQGMGIDFEQEQTQTITISYTNDEDMDIDISTNDEEDEDEDEDEEEDEEDTADIVLFDPQNVWGY